MLHFAGHVRCDAMLDRRVNRKEGGLENRVFGKFVGETELEEWGFGRWSF